MPIIKAGAPDNEVISLKAMKNYLGVDIATTKDDNTIRRMIIASRQHCENATKKSLVKKQYVQYMDDFPRTSDCGPYVRDKKRPRSIKVYWPPLISVDSFQYIDTGGIKRNLRSGEDYQIDFASEPAILKPMPLQLWPIAAYDTVNALAIAFTAGYEPFSDGRDDEATQGFDGTAVSEPETNQIDRPIPSLQGTYDVDRSIPENLSLAVQQLVAHWYKNKTPINAIAGAGGHFVPLPLHVQDLLAGETCDDFAVTSY